MISNSLSPAGIVAIFSLIAVLSVLPAAAQTDPPQTKRITVSAPEITLDHLIRNIAQQSGLTLSVDPNDPLSETLLTAYLTDEPTENVTAALVSLLSAKRAMWRWERLDDKPGDGPGVLPVDMKPGVAYRLQASSGAKVYAAKTQARILQELTELTAQMGDRDADPTVPDLATLTPALRKNQREMPEAPRGQRMTEEANERYRQWHTKQQKNSASIGANLPVATVFHQA